MLMIVWGWRADVRVRRADVRVRRADVRVRKLM
jgi:hypothetical protein